MIKKLINIAENYSSKIPVQTFNKFNIIKSISQIGDLQILDPSFYYKIYGIKFEPIRLTTQRIITGLYSLNNCIMEDSPHEFIVHLPAILNSKNAKKILIAGLGLNLSSNLLQTFHPEIERIDILEIESDIIKINQPFKTEKENYIEVNAEEYVKNLDNDSYDYAWIDIYKWGDENKILPLKQTLIEKNIPNDFFREIELLRLIK